MNWPGIATKSTAGLMGPLHAARVNGEAPPVLPIYTVAEANALTGLQDGMFIRVSNGNAGQACLAIREAGAWKVVALGATISGS